MKPLYHNVSDDWNSYGFSKWHQLILILAPILVFYSMLGNGFSYMAADDNWMLYNNAQVYSLSLDNILNYFTSFYHGQYSPVNTLAYALIYAIFGMNPFWYHAFSLLLHVCNTLLVYKLLMALFRFPAPQQGSVINGSDAHHIAFFTALLFAVHPIQVEAVAWIAASKVVFYATLFLLSLILYLKYVEKKQQRYYFTSFLLFIISFGIKEQTVILPLCLLLMDWYIKRDWGKGKLLIEKIPFFIAAIGLGIIELIGQQSFFGYNLQTHYYPFYQRLLLTCYAVPCIFRSMLTHRSDLC